MKICRGILSANLLNTLRHRVPLPHSGSHPRTPPDQTQAGGRGEEAHLSLREENCCKERQSLVSITRHQPIPPQHLLSQKATLPCSRRFRLCKAGRNTLCGPSDQKPAGTVRATLWDAFPLARGLLCTLRFVQNCEEGLVQRGGSSLPLQRLVRVSLTQPGVELASFIEKCYYSYSACISIEYLVEVSP